MTDWLQPLADKHKDQILNGRMSTSSIRRKLKLPTDQHAVALRAFCRTGKVPLDTPDNCDPLPEPAFIKDVSFQQSKEMDKSLQKQGKEVGLVHHKSYTYNTKTKTYVTKLPGFAEAICVPEGLHRRIVQMYSNQNGKASSISDIANAIHWSKDKLTKYLRCHEVTHDHEPFTREDLESKSPKELVEDTWQSQREKALRQIQEHRWNAVQAQSNKWLDFETSVLSTLQTAAEARKPLPEVVKVLDPSLTRYAVVIGLSDFHWGKYSDAKENTEAYNRQLAERYLFETTRDVISQIKHLGRPECIYVPIGSDFLNVDNYLATTTRGTPQDNDGTPAELLETAVQLLEKWIDTLRAVGPVKLVLMSGNHDRHTGLALLLYLDALYRGCGDVTVCRDRRPRVYQTYGTNLIGFIHGDGIKKTSVMAGVMAEEARAAWSQSLHRHIYTGHFHNEVTETDNSYGVVRHQLPSLSGPDRHSYLHGYFGSPKTLPVYIHDYYKGLRQVIYSAPPSPIV